MRTGWCGAAGLGVLGLVVGLSVPVIASADDDGTAMIAAADHLAWDEEGDGTWSSRRRGGRVYLSPSDLEGTIWFSKRPHRRVTVDLHGEVEIKEGKEIYVRFVDRIDDIFVIEVRWWNERVGINVLEHGVLTRIEGNQYRYTEADHLDPDCEQPEFPGIVGRGTFELLSKRRAELIQVGHLIDGSASGFTTIVERVDELPEVPLDQTYPVSCD